jgi:hypothetical protein
MIVAKQSQFIPGEEDKAKHLIEVDNDLNNLFLALQGRVRLGGATDGNNGENIAGQFQKFTSHATPDTEFNVAHTIGSVPVGVIIIGQDKAGSLYQLAATGTAWTATQVSFKCDVASVAFEVFLLK